MTLPRTLSFHAEDGHPLRAYLFEQQADASGKSLPCRGNVVIHGATAVPASYYTPFAAYLATHGFRVLTYDYRGIGRSRQGSLRGHDASMADWALLDAVAATALLQHQGDEPLLAIGHSFGGQIAAALPGEAPAGVLLVGAQSGYYRSFDNPSSLWFKARIAVPLATQIFGYLPGFLGTKEDLPKGVARQWMSWCLSPDYYLSTHPEFGERLQGFAGSALMLSFTDDDFAPLRNVQWLAQQMPSASLHHRHLTPLSLGFERIGHFGAFRLAQRDVLWPIMRAYLDGVQTRSLPTELAHASTPQPFLQLNERELIADLTYRQGACHTQHPVALPSEEEPLN